jgi:diaminopimelate epimerase
MTELAGEGPSAVGGPAEVPGPTVVPLVKYEGLGNDFLVLVDPDGSRPIGAELARQACDRHRGVGADGLLRAGPPPPGSGEHLTFQLLNADGGEAEMSGNGLRCLAHAAIDAGMVGAGELSVLTPVGRRRVQARRTGPGAIWASTEMGQPKVLGPAERCNVGHGQLLVDVGNPHLVVLGPDPGGLDVAGLGAALSEELGAATGGLNVEFVTLGPGPGQLTIRVWERGVGETLACGTGSVASAAAAHHWGRVGTKVTVNQPGGGAEVELRPDGTAVLSGPSRRIGRCWFEPTAPAGRGGP